MAQQLALLDSPPNWKLDRQTREIGRRGVAEARAALRQGSSGAGRRSSRPKAA